MAKIYPARAGARWNDDEVLKLLTSIQKQKPIPLIAAEHERTTGAINAELCKLAGDYWFNDGRTIEQISRFTGLTSAEIQQVIDKKLALKKKVLDKKTEDKEMITLLKEVKACQQQILDDKADVKEMIRLLKEVNDKLSLSSAVNVKHSPPLWGSKYYFALLDKYTV